MQTGISDYFELAFKQLKDALESQEAAMQTVAQLWTEAIQRDKLVYTFGSGHSRFVAGELYFRAGGLANVMSIDDPCKGSAERLEGFAATFMSNYAITRGDLLLVVSNSGINPLPIEIALIGKSQALPS